MNTDYLNLPIGKISKKELKPWLQWFGEKECVFVSYPDVTVFFSEVTKAKSENVIYFQEGELVEPQSFLEEKILFYVNITLYYLIGSSIKMLVKFLCDGTVEVDKIYLDDDESSDLIKENIRAIDYFFEQKSKKEVLFWKDFVGFFEKLEEGGLSKKLDIPEF